MPEIESLLAEVSNRLRQIEEALFERSEPSLEKEHFSVNEAAKLIQLAPFTVRAYCREGRIAAHKTESGRFNKPSGEFREKR